MPAGGESWAHVRRANALGRKGQPMEIGFDEGGECCRCGTRRELMSFSLDGDVCASCMTPEEFAAWRAQRLGDEHDEEIVQ
jgi:hypothetical protein